jgi:hypothetical protein
MFASRFRTNGYGNSAYGTGKPSASRYNDSKGWRRTDDEENTITTIGGGRAHAANGLGTGIAGKSGELTSDGASDESILGHHRGFGTKEGSKDGYELHGLPKQGGIVRTVAVDVQVSDR